MTILCAVQTLVEVSVLRSMFTTEHLIKTLFLFCCVLLFTLSSSLVNELFELD
jgi:hypothetical protein